MRVHESSNLPSKKRKEMPSSSSSGKRSSRMEDARPPVVAAAGGGVADSKRSRPHDASSDGDGRRWARPLLPRKKIVILPFKVTPTPPPNFVESTTERLKSVISAVHANQDLPESPEILYRSVQALCLHSHSEYLYKELSKQCEAHIRTSIESLPVDEHGEEQFLEAVQVLWSDHCRQMHLIQAVFLYLDRTFVIQNAQVRSLWHMALHLFRKKFLRTDGVAKKTLSFLLSIIERERRGELVNANLLKDVLGMYSSLSIYKLEFEESFLRATSAFYREEGALLTVELEVPAYLEHVCARLDQEKDRTHRYIDASSFKPLILATETQLLKPHTGFLYDKGFDNLIKSGDMKNISRMYNLFGRVGAWDSLQSTFASYIMREGRAIVSDESKDVDMIARILNLKVEMDLVLKDAFGSNPAFLHSLKDAFEKFINSRQNRPAELLAKYIDSLLRVGTRPENKPVSVEKVIDDCIVIFRYMQGKDVFEAFYKKDLAKRLLLNTSCSDEAERYIISKIKNECGARFTINIECMFKDINLSKELMEEYRQMNQKADTPLNVLELDVAVLTTSSWPVSTGSELTLPAPIMNHQKAFEDFYCSKHSGRRLTWQPQHAHCVLRAGFHQGRKELAVSAYQAVVLLAFNDTNIIDFQELQRRTGLDTDELKRTLTSLTRQKSRLLKKRPAGPISEKDEFTVNADFHHKLFRVRVTQQSMETVSERSSTSNRVYADRQYQIDAAIVRIMKVRKTLSHTLLVSECLSNLKFPVELPALKKRIESLLDRDYIERSTDDPNTYSYCA